MVWACASASDRSGWVSPTPSIPNAASQGRDGTTPSLPFFYGSSDTPPLQGRGYSDQTSALRRISSLYHCALSLGVRFWVA